MLWKPMTPVYPRLVQRAPEGLTLEEANEMRKKGRQLPPICKLGKNGLYSNLVKNVKEAFEECELVRINCKDMNKSDCRKIGAKLRDLVSCVLVSFEYEHILMWRGREWKSSLAPSNRDVVEKFNEESLSEKPDENLNLVDDFGRDDVIVIPKIDIVEEQLEASTKNSESSRSEINSDESLSDEPHDEIPNKNSYQFEIPDHKEDNNLLLPWLEGIMLLVEQAVDAGNAQLLDEESLDADIVLAKCVSLAKKARPGPIFQHRTKKTVRKKPEEEKRDNNEEEDDAETLVVSNRKGDGKMNSKSRKKEQIVLDVVPYGSLGVDELAKLLA